MVLLKKKKKKEDQNIEANIDLGKFAGTKEKPKEEGYRQITERREEGGVGIYTEKIGRGTLITSKTGGTILAKPGEQITRRKTGRGQIVSIGEPPSFTVMGDGMKTTYFDKRLPPEEVIGKDIIVHTEEERARRAQLTPQELLEERKQAAFEEGMKIGVFKDLSTEDVNRIAQERGIIQPSVQPGVPEAPKSFISKTAEIGVVPAVLAANLISKGLKPFGIDIGSITSEQFASTDIGKLLGLTTVAVGAYGVASVGASLLGAGGIKGLVGGNIIKAGLSKRLLFKSMLGTGIVVTAINKIISDQKNAISGTIQTAELINDSVAIGSLSPSEAILAYNELEQQLLELEEKIILWSRRNPLNWISGGKDNLIDIQNAKLQLQLKRLNI